MQDDDQKSVDEQIKSLELEIEKLMPNSSLKEISDIFLKIVTSLTGSLHGYMAFVDPENGDSVGISFSHLTGACEMYEKMGEARFKVLKDGSYGGLLGYSLDTGESLFTNDPSNHPIAHGLPPRHEHVENFLSVPVIEQEQILGQIVLGNHQDGFTDKEVDIARQVADIYAVVLKKFLYP